MTTTLHTLKPPVFEAIDVTSASAQASAIALLIKAKTFKVDSTEGVATFTLDNVFGELRVSAGQVVTVCKGAVAIYEREQFESDFEPFAPPDTENKETDA